MEVDDGDLAGDGLAGRGGNRDDGDGDADGKDVMKFVYVGGG